VRSACAGGAEGALQGASQKLTPALPPTSALLCWRPSGTRLLAAPSPAHHFHRTGADPELQLPASDLDSRGCPTVACVPEYYAAIDSMWVCGWEAWCAGVI